MLALLTGILFVYAKSAIFYNFSFLTKGVKTNLLILFFGQNVRNCENYTFPFRKKYYVEQCVKTGCNRLKLSTKSPKCVENFQHKKYTIPLFDTKCCINWAKNKENDCFTMLKIHFARNGKMHGKKGC